jgi:nucleobase:cation symporter-1, NCS1 family
MDQIQKSAERIIEPHGIDFVPLNERHGRPASLFTLFFSANMNMVAAATGAIAVSLGLGFLPGLISIVVGNIIGGILMAYHAAQGPKLGIPQMIQSRAQFGVRGALLPVFVVFILYVGFFILSAIVGGQAIAALFNVSDAVGVILLSSCVFLLFVMGHDQIHRYNRAIAGILLLFYLAVTVFIFRDYHAASSFAVTKPATVGTIMLAISIYATWQITYAPYVADYSRYLPRETSFLKSCGYTYLGTVIGSVWLMVLGLAAALISEKSVSSNISLYFATLFGTRWEAAMLIVIALSLISTCVLNLYGAFMCTLTMVTSGGNNTITKSILARATIYRIIVGIPILAICAGIAIRSGGDFIDAMTNFLLFLLYIFLPWSAINLTDYYFIRKGEYNVEDIYRTRGIYGSVNWPTIGIYILSIFVEVPFMNSALYEGFVAKQLGGADICWIVGFIVPAVLYYLANRRLLAMSWPLDLAPARKTVNQEDEI